MVSYSCALDMSLPPWLSPSPRRARGLASLPRTLGHLRTISPRSAGSIYVVTRRGLRRDTRVSVARVAVRHAAKRGTGQRGARPSCNLLDTYLHGYISLVSDAVLRAIAEPIRRAILRLVWDRERPAGEIAAHFQISRPAVSKHLRVLREAELVEERRQGTQRLYRARPERLAEARRALESFWDDGLATIKRSAESDARRRET